MKKLLFIVIFFIASTSIVHANGYPGGCEAPFGIPSSCSGDGEYEPDFNCINGKFLDPELVCCPNKCTGSTSPVDPATETFTELNFFNTTVKLSSTDPNTIPTLVNLGITTFLGIISLYVLFRGIYVAAFLRTSATDAAKIASLNKEIVNLMIGFTLAWGAIFIVQLVANIIGLGSLQNLQVGGTEGAYVITIG